MSNASSLARFSLFFFRGLAVADKGSIRSGHHHHPILCLCHVWPLWLTLTVIARCGDDDHGDDDNISAYCHDVLIMLVVSCHRIPSPCRQHAVIMTPPSYRHHVANALSSSRYHRVVIVVWSCRHRVVLMSSLPASPPSAAAAPRRRRREAVAGLFARSGAGAGGFLQTVLFGLSGLRLWPDRLELNPSLVEAHRLQFGGVDDDDDDDGDDDV